MDSFYDTGGLKCPFCLNAIADSNPGETICSKCQAEFEVDDRGECVFANPDNLRLPVNGVVCRVCGLVQAMERDSCGVDGFFDGF
jgi:predicted amidophosphoribosyltransferase